jgi:hypothetical protein
MKSAIEQMAEALAGANVKVKRPVIYIGADGSRNGATTKRFMKAVRANAEKRAQRKKRMEEGLSQKIDEDKDS